MPAVLMPGVVADERGETVVGLAHLLLDRAFAAEVEADAAVLLGDRQPEQPDLARFPDQVARDFVVLLDLSASADRLRRG